MIKLNLETLKKFTLFAYFIVIVNYLCSCQKSNEGKNVLTQEDKYTLTPDISNKVKELTFFGDSALTIVSSNRPNGYLVKFFQTEDLTLINLSRGDSITDILLFMKFL